MYDDSKCLISRIISPLPDAPEYHDGAGEGTKKCTYREWNAVRKCHIMTVRESTQRLRTYQTEPLTKKEP